MHDLYASKPNGYWALRILLQHSNKWRINMGLTRDQQELVLLRSLH